jgi:cell cycle arrest protein BUB3
VKSCSKFMTRCLASLADGQGEFYSFFLLFLRWHPLRVGYAIGSVESRIGIEFPGTSPEAHDKKYAFKCHRQTIEDIDHV